MSSLALLPEFLLWSPRATEAKRGHVPIMAGGWGGAVGQPLLPTLLQRLMLVVIPQLIEVQAEYHRKSLTLLQAVLPQIKAQQGERKPCLGQGWGVGGRGGRVGRARL